MDKTYIVCPSLLTKNENKRNNFFNGGYMELLYKKYIDEIKYLNDMPGKNMMSLWITFRMN